VLFVYSSDQVTNFLIIDEGPVTHKTVLESLPKKVVAQASEAGHKA